MYLDYNATTPLEKSVLEAISSALKHAWGNPSSKSPSGQEARRVIEESRQRVSAMLNATTADDIIFTSGGTESNNLVYNTVVREFQSRNPDSSSLPHVIISNVEHPATILPLEHLSQDLRQCELTLIPVTPDGHVDPCEIEQQLKDNTILISVMLANNETGVINSLSEIVKVVRAFERKSRRRIYVHTDAAQAIGKIKVDVQGAFWFLFIFCFGPNARFGSPSGNL